MRYIDIEMLEQNYGRFRDPEPVVRVLTEAVSANINQLLQGSYKSYQGGRKRSVRNVEGPRYSTYNLLWLCLSLATGKKSNG
jgi:hypothetical protein